MSKRTGLDRIAYWFEATLLTVLTSLAVILAALQIVLRSGFSISLEWADPIIQVAVFWLGLVGAVAAARASRHIRIDLLSRWLPARAASVLDAFTGMITCGVAGLIAWHGARLVIGEKGFPTPVVFGIESWMVQLIIPISLGLISLFYLIDAFKKALNRT